MMVERSGNVKEAQGNIFTGGHDWLVFTANSVVTSTKRLVMGAGIAKQVRDRYPGIDRFFGETLLDNNPAGARFHLLVNHPKKNHRSSDQDRLA